jgi:hypothetical protein
MLMHVIARSEATKQSISPLRHHGLLRFARMTEFLPQVHPAKMLRRPIDAR